MTPTLRPNQPTTAQAMTTCEPPMDIDPPGYREALQRMRGPRYGWAVLVGGPRTPGSGDSYGHIAVITVSDWERAKESGPYRWLNTHPNQPVRPEETKALAIETWERMKRSRS